MEFFGFSITLLSIVIVYLAWNNGKWMRQAIAKMDERAELRHQEVIKLFEKMDERTAKISELIEKIPEKIAKTISNMSEKGEG